MIVNGKEVSPLNESKTWWELEHRIGDKENGYDWVSEGHIYDTLEEAQTEFDGLSKAHPNEVWRVSQFFGKMIWKAK